MGVVPRGVMTKVRESIKILIPHLSKARKKRIAEVVAGRTSSLAVLLENVRDKGNRNAVMRSMDAVGLYALYRLSYGEAAADSVQRKGAKIRTDVGARKWILATNWSHVDTCLQHLRANGYKIASTMPNASLQLADVDFTEKLVVAFGNEHVGVSDFILGGSDFHFSIPMTGFVQSLNISVCVAVTLYHAYFQRLAKLVRGEGFLVSMHLLPPSLQGKNGDLSEEEYLKLTLQYYINSIGTEKAYSILSKYRADAG